MKKQFFNLKLLLIIQLFISVAAAAPTVNISDDHALETDLNEAASDAINTTDTETSDGVIADVAWMCCGCERMEPECNCCDN